MSNLQCDTLRGTFQEFLVTKTFNIPKAVIKELGMK